MSALMSSAQESASNPLDVMEQIVAANDWIFDRRSDSEMAAEAPGAPRSRTEWRKTGMPSSLSMPKWPIHSRSLASASNS